MAVGHRHSNQLRGGPQTSRVILGDVEGDLGAAVTDPHPRALDQPGRGRRATERAATLGAPPATTAFGTLQGDEALKLTFHGRNIDAEMLKRPTSMSPRLGRQYEQHMLRAHVVVPAFESQSTRGPQRLAQLGRLRWPVWGGWALPKLRAERSLEFQWCHTQVIKCTAGHPFIGRQGQQQMNRTDLSSSMTLGQFTCGAHAASKARHEPLTAGDLNTVTEPFPDGLFRYTKPLPDLSPRATTTTGLCHEMVDQGVCLSGKLSTLGCSHTQPVKGQRGHSQLVHGLNQQTISHHDKATMSKDGLTR